MKIESVIYKRDLVPPLTLMIILHFWVFPLTLMSNLKMA